MSSQEYARGALRRMCEVEETPSFAEWCRVRELFAVVDAEVDSLVKRVIKAEEPMRRERDSRFIGWT